MEEDGLVPRAAVRSTFSRLFLHYCGFPMQTFWRAYIRRPVCEVHGRWDKGDVEDGFCGRCLDDHLERRW